jgi:hypothetical protein
MRTVLSAIATGVLGAGVTVGAAYDLPPAAALAVGAVVTALVHWRSVEKRDFRVAGTVYALAAATGVLSVEGLPAVVRWSVYPSLLGFGLLSLLVVAAFVVVRIGARAVARRFVPDDVAESVAEFASTLASAGLLLWTLVQTQERLVRTGGVATFGTAALAADVLGYRLPYDPAFLQSAIDVQVIVFAGAVVVGFHTLASWEAAWRVAGATARSGRRPAGSDETGSTVASPDAGTDADPGGE